MMLIFHLSVLSLTPLTSLSESQALCRLCSAFQPASMPSPSLYLRTWDSGEWNSSSWEVSMSHHEYSWVQALSGLNHSALYFTDAPLQNIQLLLFFWKPPTLPSPTSSLRPFVMTFVGWLQEHENILAFSSLRGLNAVAPHLYETLHEVSLGKSIPEISVHCLELGKCFNSFSMCETAHILRTVCLLKRLLGSGLQSLPETASQGCNLHGL